MSQIIYYLFTKRDMRRKWIFLIALVPFVLFALVGIEYGAFWVYMIPALMCLLQYLYPTIALWGMFFAAFVAASGMYSYLLVTDIYKLIIGVQSKALLDLDDSVVFVALVFALIGITYVLYISRPDLSYPSKYEKET